MFNLIVIILFFACLVWLALRLLAWFLVKKTLTSSFIQDIEIGSVGFFTFGNNKIIFKNGISVEIGKIWPSSSVFNGEIKKAFAICLADVRVQVDVAKFVSNKTFPNKNSESKNAPTQQHGGNASLSYLKYVKFGSLLVDNAQLIVIDGPAMGFMTNVSIQELVVDADLHHTSLQANMKVSSLVTKLFQRASKEGETESCLTEISFSYNLSTLADVTDKSIKELLATIRKPYIHLNQGLVEKITYERESVERTNRSSSHSQRNSQHLLSLLPKNICVQLEESQVIFARETAQREMHCAVKRIKFDLQYGIKENTLGDAHFHIDIRDVIAGTSQVHLGSLTQCEIQVQLNDHSLAVLSGVQNAFIGYHHEEMQYWLALLPKKKKVPTATLR